MTVMHGQTRPGQGCRWPELAWPGLKMARLLGSVWQEALMISSKLILGFIPEACEENRECREDLVHQGAFGECFVTEGKNPAYGRH